MNARCSKKENKKADREEERVSYMNCYGEWYLEALPNITKVVISKDVKNCRNGNKSPIYYCEIYDND